GAGPIVGPIIAAVAFGWLPAFLWVLLGCIFFGSVHDFSALIASVRHKARNVAEIARQYMSVRAWRLFLGFTLLALIYVLVVFIDLTSSTFVMNEGVATSSVLYIGLAIAFGFSIYRLKIPTLWGSLIFVPLVFLGAWLGEYIPFPAGFFHFFGISPGKGWDILLVIYCYVASITPVWILLQPRDYLSSYLLYASVLAGFLGILFGKFTLSYPAFIGFSSPQLGPLFPILFVTVACGAISGFHSIIASGTTAKQLDKESHARPIGYGAMLIEGLVAVIAISTVILVMRGEPLAGQPPLVIYGTGIGKFLSVFGIPANLGFAIGLLALSTFILTTLDTATRLGRYMLQELFGLEGKNIRYLTSLVVLILPTLFVLITLRDAAGNPVPAWKIIWPVFGATNQMLAGLVLLAVTVWLKKTGRKFYFTLLPMVFMMVMTLGALAILISQYKWSLVGIIALVLFVLAILLVVEAWRSLTGQAAAKAPGKGA
ncbi:MAG: carbon starvation CstA family protein, partial [candidate division NC10 bacterium]|nr:carbon starvation CstA family protein [candidate division NC10 bacterium]